MYMYTTFLLCATTTAARNNVAGRNPLYSAGEYAPTQPPWFLDLRLGFQISLRLKLWSCQNMGRKFTLYTIPKISLYQLSSPVNKLLPFKNYMKSRSWQGYKGDFRWVQNDGDLFTGSGGRYNNNSFQSRLPTKCFVVMWARLRALKLNLNCYMHSFMEKCQSGGWLRESWLLDLGS